MSISKVEYPVMNPYTNQQILVPIVDWREGLRPGGKLIGDRLPVVLIENPEDPSKKIIMRVFNCIKPDGSILKDDRGYDVCELNLVDVNLTERVDCLGHQCLLTPIYKRPLYFGPEDALAQLRENKMKYPIEVLFTNAGQSIESKHKEKKALKSKEEKALVADEKKQIVKKEIQPAKDTMKPKGPSKHARKVANQNILKKMRKARHHKKD